MSFIEQSSFSREGRMMIYLEFILSSAWYIIPLIIGVVSFLSWRNSKKHEVPSMPSVSSISFCTIIFTRLCQGYKLSDIADFIFPLLTGMPYLHHKEKLIKFTWAGRRFALCFGLDSAEKIFRSPSALDKEKLYKILEPFLGTSLLLSGGDKWKTRRKMLAPAFHFQILQDFILTFNDNSNAFVETLKGFDGNVVSIIPMLKHLTLNIIIETAMGLKINVEDKEAFEFVQAVESGVSVLTDRFVKPWNWINFVHNLLPVGKETKRINHIAKTFRTKIIHQRRAKLFDEEEAGDVMDDFKTDRDDLRTNKRRILLDLLLYYNLTDSTFTEEDISEEVITFIVAGYITSSVAVSWILYLLGLYEKTQEVVYEEMKLIFGEDMKRMVTAEDLRQMKYLECVIKETLRLYPPFPFVARHLKTDTEAEGYVIPANTSVVMSIYTIHHDPDIYPNPEIFDPDRFLPENCSKRHPYAFIPFAGGPRNCIGQRFAMMEMKIIIAYILRNFKVHSLDHRDKLCFSGDLLLTLKNQIRLKLEKR